MVDVILLERVESLGHIGDIVKVKPGYARNFLLPQGKALRATKANLDQFAQQRTELEAKNAAMRAKAEAEADKLKTLKAVILRQASETGQLYGSVSSRDIVDAALESGHTVHRTHVFIDTPIKTLGLFPVRIKLHPEVSFTITVNIARSAEEAVAQAHASAKEAAAAALKPEAVFVPKEAANESEAAEASDEQSEKAPAKAKKTKKAAAETDEAAEAKPKKTAKAKKA